MLTLTKKLRRESIETNNNNNVKSKISIRDRLLVKELQDLPQLLPPSCSLSFPDDDKLYDFKLIIQPADGYWSGGRFTFSINVTPDYNMAPPIVKCETILYHPNISEEGSVCLSLLRQSSIDELGWAPTRTLKDIVWGLEALFGDLLNFEDPLNPTAAEVYYGNKSKFKQTVQEYIKKYC